MLLALVKAAVEEIAWEGPPGISWGDLVQRLTEHGFEMDSYIKEALWTELTCKPPAFVRKKKAHDPKEPQDDKVLDLPDAIRQHYLLLDAHPDLAENDLSRRALQLVAKARASGCLGESLASSLGVSSRDMFYPLEGLRTAGLLVGVAAVSQKDKVQDEDLGPKKKSAGAQTNAASAANVHGNLFIFSRFFDPEHAERAQIQAFLQSSSSRLQGQIRSALKLNSSVGFEADLRALVGQVLEETSNRAVSRRTVGKVYLRIRNDMVAAGDVECVRAWDSRSKRTRDAVCIAGTHCEDADMDKPLLAITEDAPAEVHSSNQAVLPQHTTFTEVPKATLRVAERSISQQAEDLIRCTSKYCNGITGPELAEYLEIRRKHCERITNDLVKRSRATRVFESDGRAHLNRYYDPHSGTKRSLAQLHTEQPSKLTKISHKADRVDLTFIRRKQQVERMLENCGILTPQEVKKTAADDLSLGNMDRKTAAKLLSEVAASSNVGLVISDKGQIRFAYWKPLHTEETAQKVFDEALKVQEQSRFQKIQKLCPLALTNEAVDSGTVRRTLPQSVAAKSLSRLGRVQMLTTPQATFEHKILQHYGFHVAVVARIRLLHGMLLRKSKLEFNISLTPSKIVEDMDLDIFLQVIGCGTFSQQLEDILLSGTDLLIRDVPDELRKMLLGRTVTGGTLRSVNTVRRLMRHLTALGLVTSSGEDAHGPTQSLAPIVYQLNQIVHVPTFSAAGDAPPAASFDLARPEDVEGYWSRLKDEVLKWRGHVGAKGDKDSSSEDKESKRRATALPGNPMVPEIFNLKNWTSYNWLTPHQRVSLNEFYLQVHEESNADAGLDTGRILTPKSAEVMALSRRILVGPDQIIKHCRHLAEIHGPHPSGRVEFSSLLAVRFKCHVCGYLCFQRSAITEHYGKVHSGGLPEDESKFTEADFYAQRLEQARPTFKDGRRRLRKRQVAKETPPQPWAEADGARSSEEERWGMEVSDDPCWLQLFTVAETMVSMQHVCQGKSAPRRPIGSELRADASTWPMLSRLSGRSALYCRSRLHRLLSQDVKNRRNVAAMRSSEMQAETGEHLFSSMKATIGRVLAKSLLLTAHEAPARWWKPFFLSADVKAMVDCVIKQWQCDGLVSKYKIFDKVKEAKCNRLPKEARPSWLLTWHSRGRMFGKAADATRWQDVLLLLTGARTVVEDMLPESSDGAQLLVLSAAVASGAAKMCPEWGDDFYQKSIPSVPPWHSKPKEEDEGDDLNPSSGYGGYGGGVQTHLQLTSDEPTLKSVRVHCDLSKDAGDFFKFLCLSREESSKIIGSSSEPLNPQMLYFGMGFDHAAQNELERDPEDESDPDREELSDTDGVNGKESQGGEGVERSSERSSSSSFAVSAMRTAFESYVGDVSSAQELLHSVALLLKALDGRAKELLPGLSPAKLREVYRETLRETKFEVVIACLEELRFLVPFPCGKDFRWVLATDAAPYCLKQVEENPETEGILLLRSFSKTFCGRHWLQREFSEAAAAYVVYTAFGSPSQRWLPTGMVAPCAWINAKGQVNLLTLRCLVSRLLQLLLRYPLASAEELLASTEPFELTWHQVSAARCHLGGV